MTCEIRPINALRANKENDNTLLSPVECLQDAIADIESGEVPCNKVLVLMLNADDANYHIRWAMANMRASEAVALCELTKDQFVRMING